MSSEKPYFFSGDSVGFAARFHSNGDDDDCDINRCFGGSAALPPTGGCLESTSKGEEIYHPKHGFVLSFKSASASVRGILAEQPRVELQNTLASLKVQESGLEIERLSSHVLAVDPRNADDRDDHRQVVFSHVKEPEIFGVKVGGNSLTIEFDKDLLAVSTQRELLEKHKHSHDFKRAFRDLFSGHTKTAEDEISIVRGFCKTTIVKRISFGDERLDKDLIQGGNRVVLPNFGSIAFGELYVGANSRYLSLVRAELNARCTGHVTLCYFSVPDPNPTP